MTIELKNAPVIKEENLLYDDRNKYYYCEVRVNIRSAYEDTTVIVAALIFRDFTTLERRQ